MKDKLSTHQETISVLSKQKEAQIKLYKTQEDKELDKVIKLENKVKKAQRANPRLYDIGGYNDNLALMLTPDYEEVIRLEKESRSKLSDLIRLFDYDKLNNLYDLFVPQREKSSEQRYFSARSRLSHINVINGKSKESFNKQTTLLEKRMDESIPLDKQCQSSLEIFKVKSNVNTIIMSVELCKQKIANRTYIGYIDPSIKSTIESNFCPVISRISAGLNQFLREYYYADHMNVILGVYTELDEVANLQCNYLELLEKCEDLETEVSKSKMMSKSFESVQKHAINLKLNLQQCKEKIKNDMLFKVNKTKDFCKEHEHYFEIQDLKAQLQDKGIVISKLKKLIEKLKVTAQTLPANKKSILKNMNMLAPGMYKLHTEPSQTRTSQPPLKSNPRGDIVLHNKSQGKSQEVEDQRRSVKLSKNKMSVTTCNDSLNAKTLNVQFVSAMCDKCVLHDKHDMCVLKSVVKPLKETVASESNMKLRNFTRKLYERVRKTCSWWYPKFTPSGYIWKPKSEKENVNPIVSMPLGNATRTANVMDTMTSRNDQIASILGYGDLVQGAITIKRVYYVEGLNHNLFSIGQFFDADLEVAFRSSTCFIRDLKGNSLLTGSRGMDLYSITLQDINSPNPICLMAKATSSQTWLWHCRLSHLNFNTINLLSKNDIMTLHEYFAAEGILHQTSVARTPEQNDIVERQNRTLVEAARTMLSAAKVPLFFWAEAIATACFTQNRSLVIPRHEKTPYHIINDQKPSVKFFHIFGSICFIVRDGENFDKIKEKGDECIFMGYSTQLRAYRVFNKRTRVIMESIHVNFDELPQMASDKISSDPAPECQNMAHNHDSLSPAIQRQANVPQADKTVTTSNELDLLFSLMFDEMLNGSSKVVSKSSAVSAADAPNQRQHHTTPLNNHTTPVPTCQVPTLAPTVISSEKINQA
nr:hypothetical protein [Tanacetum cinerariifolium]